MNANQIVIPCRLSYADIWEPKSINGSDPKYSCCLLIPKSDTETVQRLQTLIERIKKDPVALAKWGGKLPPEKIFKSRCAMVTRRGTTRTTLAAISSMPTPARSATRVLLTGGAMTCWIRTRCTAAATLT